ncbi:glycosyltransferase family 39 protein, partial [bacterium]|nr:glycosyltransferase family 39 protein [candidate division CSSED10-310 bacterium]
GAFKLLGVSKLSLYLPCILTSILTVFMIFILARKLFGTRFGFAVAFIYSVLAWNIVFARTGYRAVLSPLFVLLTFWFYYRTLDSKKWLSKFFNAAGCGLCAGIGLHTYFAFRGIYFMLIIVGLHTFFTEFRRGRNDWREVFVDGIKRSWIPMVVLIFLLTAALPLIQYAVKSPENWDTFMGRQNTLFIGNDVKAAHSWRPLIENLKNSLLIFHYKAKVGNFFNNDWPIVSRPVSFFMIMGLAIFLRHINRRGPFFVVMVFLFGMLPSMLSKPDAARSLIATIGAAAFAAAGATGVGRFLRSSALRKYAPLTIILMLLWMSAAEFNLYFVKSADDYLAQFGYARKHTLIGYEALSLGKDNTVYVSQGHFIDTPKFLCFQLPNRDEVFSITDGEVIDVVAESRLIQNVNRILNKEHPSGKGLAFVFEKDMKNEPLFDLVKKRYPVGKYKEYRDAHYDDSVIFYTYIIPKEIVNQHSF